MTICDDLWPSARRGLIIGARYIREVYISDVNTGQRAGVREIKRRTGLVPNLLKSEKTPKTCVILGVNVGDLSAQDGSVGS